MKKIPLWILLLALCMIFCMNALAAGCGRQATFSCICGDDKTFVCKAHTYFTRTLATCSRVSGCKRVLEYVEHQMFCQCGYGGGTYAIEDPLGTYHTLCGLPR